jgi:hypothetical protein
LPPSRRFPLETIAIREEKPMIDNDALRALPRDVPNYHERQAAHLRALAEAATTSGVRQRLLRQAEEHERLTEAEE